MISRYRIMPGILIINLVLCACGAVYAQKASGKFFEEKGIALKGYDVVSYFNTGAPQKGDAAYQYEWSGVTWQFSNQQHLEQFKENPERYIPQYGGYCAFGMSNNYKAPTDPFAWTIINDKLYLNYNRSVKEKWSKDSAEHIDKADKNWTVLKDQADKK